jgi:hypothetical protein
MITASATRLRVPAVTVTGLVTVPMRNTTTDAPEISSGFWFGRCATPFRYQWSPAVSAHRSDRVHVRPHTGREASVGRPRLPISLAAAGPGVQISRVFLSLPRAVGASGTPAGDRAGPTGGPRIESAQLIAASSSSVVTVAAPFVYSKVTPTASHCARRRSRSAANGKSGQNALTASSYRRHPHRRRRA